MKNISRESEKFEDQIRSDPAIKFLRLFWNAPCIYTFRIKSIKEARCVFFHSRILP